MECTRLSISVNNFYITIDNTEYSIQNTEYYNTEITISGHFKFELL